MNSIDLGKYIKQLRESNFLSIRQLSQLSGVSNSYISQVENGKRGTPTSDILEKLAPHLNVSYEALMEMAGYINFKKDEEVPPSILTGKDELDICQSQAQETRRSVANR